MADQPQFDFKANYLNFFNYKPTSFFGFRYPNSADPARVAAVMMPIGQGATEYAFELLAAGK